MKMLSSRFALGVIVSDAITIWRKGVMIIWSLGLLSFITSMISELSKQHAHNNVISCGRIIQKLHMTWQLLYSWKKKSAILKHFNTPFENCHIWTQVYTSLLHKSTRTSTIITTKVKHNKPGGLFYGIYGISSSGTQAEDTYCSPGLIAIWHSISYDKWPTEDRLFHSPLAQA